MGKAGDPLHIVGKMTKKENNNYKRLEDKG